MNQQKLRLQQVSAKLAQFQSFVELTRPPKGWVATVRTAIGMTTTQLAKHLGLNQSSVTRLEQSEVNNTISLKELNKAANALGCTVVYTLVPKHKTLDALLQKQAEKVAKKQIDRIAHHMSLEGQRPSSEQLDELYQDLVKTLLNHPKKIWNDD